MQTDTKDDLISRLENLEDVTFDEEKNEIEDLIDSSELDDAESLIDELESERYWDKLDFEINNLRVFF